LWRAPWGARLQPRTGSSVASYTCVYAGAATNANSALDVCLADAQSLVHLDRLNLYAAEDQNNGLSGRRIKERI